MPTHAQRLLESGTPVDRDIWRAAKARDRTDHIALRRQGNPFLIKPRFSSGADCAAAMARIMADRVAASDACSDQDLSCAGFSGAEIAHHADAARKLASALLADRVL